MVVVCFLQVSIGDGSLGMRSWWQESGNEILVTGVREWDQQQPLHLQANYYHILWCNYIICYGCTFNFHSVTWLYIVGTKSLASRYYIILIQLPHPGTSGDFLNLLVICSWIPAESLICTSVTTALYSDMVVHKPALYSDMVVHKPALYSDMVVQKPTLYSDMVVCKPAL